jgi:hypothetical protein
MPFDSTLCANGAIATGTGAALNAVVLGPFDVTRFANCVVQITGTFNATVTFQGSNDEVNPTNWIPILSSNIATGALSSTNNATSTMWYVPSVSRWFRLQVTAYTSGTVNAACFFCETALPLVQNSSQTVSGAVTLNPKTSGGATNSRVFSAATTNATSVKASAGTIHSFVLSNTTAAAKFFKVYAKASAPTVGTDTPIATWGIPANGTIVYMTEVGMAVPTGIAYAITGAVADADTTATAAGDVTGHLTYA